MRELERWLWLNHEEYPNAQTTVFHDTTYPLTEKEKRGNYTVAEFKKTYQFEKKVVNARLRFSGDTEFDLWMNRKMIATGPVNVGGDFFHNHLCRNQHYATELIVCPDS